MRRIAVGTEAEGGDRFHDSRNPIIWFPKRDDLHHMRHAAGENKNAEANEHPIEGQITPLTNKINKGEWNDEIAQSRSENPRSDAAASGPDPTGNNGHAA